MARITGTVRDASGAAVAAASVSVEGVPAAGRPRLVVTDGVGRYEVLNLGPGTYVVRAEKPGFAPASYRGVELAAGGGQVVDLALQVGAHTDEVVVDGTAGIDVSNPALPQRIDSSLLRDVPTSRSIPDLVNLVPGIVAAVAFGGTQGSNTLSIEGVDMSDTLTPEPSLRLNQNWIESLQVASFGAGADYGSTTGAFANAVVRAGGAAWTGLGEMWVVPTRWVADNTGDLEEDLSREFAPRDVDHNWNANAQAGGPLRRGRLWLFSGLDYTTLRERPAGYDGPARRQEDDVRAIAKLTSTPHETVRVEAMADGGRRRIEAEDLGPFVAPEAATDSEQQQFAWSARVSWVAGGATLVEARYSGLDSPVRGVSRSPATCSGPAPHFDVVTGLATVNAWECYHLTRRRDEVGASITGTATTGPVRHELRAGAAFVRTGGRNRWTVPGGVQYVDADGEPILVRLTPGYSRTANASVASAFLEDRVRVGDRLTVVPGVRLDVNRVGTPEVDEVLTTAPVSPRLGAAYDLTRDHRTVVRVHYGRYHDPVNVTTFRTLQTDLSDVPPIVEVVPVGPEQYDEVNRVTTVQTVWIDPGLRQSRVDQWMAGVERQVARDLTVQAHYLARRFDDFIGFVDTGSTWAPIERQDPGPDGRLGTADDGGIVALFRKTNPGNEHLVYTNPAGARRRYDAAQVVARRRYADNWQLQASYTWSRTTGNTGNVIYTNSGFGDLATTFANPNRAINADGHGPLDPTHEVKLLGSYRLPVWGGVMVSGVFRHTTGYAWGREAAFPGAGLGTATVRMEPAGTRRVASIDNLDLRLEKTVPLGPRREVAFFVDGFNVTNQGVPDSDVSGPVWAVSGPNLGVPTAWRPARSWRATVRVTF